jgi:hypothetical protein
LGVLDSIFSNELKLDKLKKLFCVRDSLENGTEIKQGSIMVDASESSKAVPSADTVALSLKESGNKF